MVYQLNVGSHLPFDSNAQIQGNPSPKKLPDGDAVPEKSDVPDDEDENPLHGPLEPVDDGVAVDQPDRLTQLD